MGASRWGELEDPQGPVWALGPGPWLRLGVPKPRSPPTPLRVPGGASWTAEHLPHLELREDFFGPLQLLGALGMLRCQGEVLWR